MKSFIRMFIQLSASEEFTISIKEASVNKKSVLLLIPVF